MWWALRSTVELHKMVKYATKTANPKRTVNHIITIMPLINCVPSRETDTVCLVGTTSYLPPSPSCMWHQMRCGCFTFSNPIRSQDVFRISFKYHVFYNCYATDSNHGSKTTGRSRENATFRWHFTSLIYWRDHNGQCVVVALLVATFTRAFQIHNKLRGSDTILYRLCVCVWAYNPES